MVTRLTAEFENPETAELALGKIRDLKGIYSSNLVYSHSANKTENFGKNTRFTLLPTGLTTNNYMTAVMESPTSKDEIPEYKRKRSAKVFIVCDGSGTDKISAVLNSMGGINIH